MPITISTDTVYSTIAGSYVNGDRITIDSGATLTIDSQPASGVYFGDFTISNGRLLIDGRSVDFYLYLLFQETKILTTARPGKFEVQGKYYQIGISTGIASQTITLPFNACLPYIEVETAAGSEEYEFWGNITTQAFSVAGSTGILGAVFKQIIASTTLTFGNGVNGRIPPAGAKIRIPNVILASTTSATPTVPSLNSTVNNRYKTESAASGEYLLNKCLISGWYLNLRFAYSLIFNEVGIYGFAQLESVQIPVSWTKVILSGERLRIIGCTISFSQLYAWGFVSSAGNTGLVHCTACLGSLNELAVVQYNRINVAYSVCFDGLCSDLTVTNCLFVGNTVYVSGADFLFDTNQASDSTNGIENTDATTGGLGCWFYFVNAFNIKIRNHSILTGGTAPPRAIIEFSNARNISLEDIGSQSLPINLNNRTPRIVQMFSSNLATNLSFKRCYFTPYSQSFSNAIAQYIVGCFLQNVWYNGYTKALPVFANNQVIKGSQGNITLGTSGIPTTFSLSGTHFYDQFGSNTSGAIGILFSEKTTDAISANAYVLASANSSKPIVFNGTGRLIMQTSGDTITYTRPYFVLGYSGFTGHTISASGTYSIEYDIDKGDGFSGTWKAIANITTEVVNPAVGFKEKIRFTANNTATTNQVQGFYLNGITTLAQQQAAIYVDTSQAKLELTGLIAGSEVRVYRTSDEAELAGIEASETTFSYTYEWSSNFDVDIVVFRIDYIPVRLTLALTSTGLSAPIQQRFDRVYLNP